MEKVLKTGETMGWTAIREVVKELMKLIVEHGISRVLVAGGLIVTISFLVRIPSDAWQIKLYF